MCGQYANRERKEVERWGGTSRMNDLLVCDYVSVPRLNHKHLKGRDVFLQWQYTEEKGWTADTDLGVTCRDVIAGTGETDEALEKESPREEGKDRALACLVNRSLSTVSLWPKIQSGADSPALPFTSSVA